MTAEGVSPLVAARRLCCPRCGRGRLFEGFLTLAEQCRVCGLHIARADSGDGPAVFLIFVLSFSVVPLALWVAMTVSWPLWLHALVWSVVLIGLTLGLLRPAKAALVALQYRHRREEYGE